MAEPRSPRVLVVGLGVGPRDEIRQLLAQQNASVAEAASLATALRHLREHPTDMILCDACTGSPGIQLLLAARALDPTIGFVVLTDREHLPHAIEALRQGADDYVLHPFDPDEIRHVLYRTLRYRELSRERRERARSGGSTDPHEDPIYYEAFLTAIDAIESRDGYAGQPVERVAKLAVEVARALGLKGEELRRVWIAGLVRNLGMMGVPEHILRKPTTLTAEESAEVRRHPSIGAEMVGRSESLREVVPAILHHHERWDGHGYPHGLTGCEIPLEGRILSVVDAYNAMISPRPYRTPRSPTEAVDELRRCAGEQFDAEVVEALVQVLGSVGRTGAEPSQGVPLAGPPAW